MCSVIKVKVFIGEKWHSLSMKSGIGSGRAGPEKIGRVRKIPRLRLHHRGSSSKRVWLRDRGQGRFRFTMRFGKYCPTWVKFSGGVTEILSIHEWYTVRYVCLPICVFRALLYTAPVVVLLCFPRRRFFLPPSARMKVRRVWFKNNHYIIDFFSPGRNIITHFFS